MPTAAPSAYSSPAWDEAFDTGGEIRPVARTALETVGAHDLRALRALVHEETRAAGMSFNADGGRREFVVDPVPRVIDAEEWTWLARGLEQRVRALDAFVADVHGPQRIIADGVMPGRVLGGAEYYEPELAGLRPPGRRFIGVAGFDIVRDDDGVLAVLEDNLRTPSGIAFAIATRAALAATLPEEVLAGVQPVEGVVELLREALLAAVPEAAPDPADPHVVLLTDGAANSAHWEHAWLARALGDPARASPPTCRRAATASCSHGAARRRDLPPHGRRTAATRRVGRLLVPADAQGHARRGQPVRHRRRGRQAHAGLRRGHGPLLPRRGAADPLRARRTTWRAPSTCARRSTASRSSS